MREPSAYRLDWACDSAAVAALLFGSLLAGCASQPNHRTTTQLSVPSDPQTDRRTILHGGERGLEVRQWFVADDAEIIAAAMTAHGNPDVVPADDRERLRRNGLRLVRVPLDELHALEADLGGVLLRNIGWHGQVLRWQEFLSRPLVEPRALAVDGRVQLFDAGSVRLMGRAWLTHMEDGQRLSVQIVPQHYRSAPLSYYKLLGRDMGQGNAIPSMSIDLLLEEGHAYVLTCEAPLVEWNGNSRDKNGAAKDDSGNGAALSAMAGPDVAGGPPTTIGQLLLRSDHASSLRGRGMLIFVPRIHPSPETSLTGVARMLRGTNEAASD